MTTAQLLSISHLVKKYLSIWIIALILASCGSHRATMRSQRKAPDWLHGIQQGYVIAVGTGWTHEEARDRAMNAVREQIVNAIAVQVIAQTEQLTREETRNQFTNFVDHFETTVNARSEFVDALRGISISRVNDFYWEQFGRGTDAFISYHVKYPFSEAELRGLIADFEAYDRRIGNEIEAIEQRRNYDSVEQILEDINRLKYLARIGTNEKQRRSRALRSRLEYMLLDIRIQRMEDRPGFIRYHLRLYDRPIETRQTPDIFATCPIRVGKVTAFPEFTEVDYTFDDCDTRAPQSVTLSYSFEGFRTERSFSFSR